MMVDVEPSIRWVLSCFTVIYSLITFHFWIVQKPLELHQPNFLEWRILRPAKTILQDVIPLKIGSRVQSTWYFQHG